jgi:uncharacterized lipoprotein YajG
MKAKPIILLLAAIFGLTACSVDTLTLFCQTPAALPSA